MTQSLWDCRAADLSGVPPASGLARNIRMALRLTKMLSGTNSFWLGIRTMPTAAAAAIAATRKIRRSEHQQAARVEIKITGHHRQRSCVSAFAMKRRHAAGTEAGFIPQVRRHARQQFVWNVRGHAPARTFVGGGGAKLAAVGPAAERALAGVAGLLTDWIGCDLVCVHLRANETAPVTDKSATGGFKSLVLAAPE